MKDRRDMDLCPPDCGHVLCEVCTGGHVGMSWGIEPVNGVVVCGPCRRAYMESGKPFEYHFLRQVIGEASEFSWVLVEKIWHLPPLPHWARSPDTEEYWKLYKGPWPRLWTPAEFEKRGYRVRPKELASKAVNDALAATEMLATAMGARHPSKELIKAARLAAEMVFREPIDKGVVFKAWQDGIIKQWKPAKKRAVDEDVLA